MIRRNEYKIIKKLDKNKMSVEMIRYASYPGYIINLDKTNGIERISKKWDLGYKGEEKINSFLNKCGKTEFTKHEKTTLKNLNILLERNLIEFDSEIFIKGNGSITIRFFTLTKNGYEQYIQYRNNYRFWIPIIISITSLIISICFVSS